MRDFSAKQRLRWINVLESRKFDIVIIGGGITGAGIFLDAQSRGLSCCLVEMQDFSEGTSSRSTRLIHGGLRYLKQWNFRLVGETGKERNIVQKIARHLTVPKKIIVPAINGGNFSKLQLALALKIYEWLAKVPKRYKHRQLSEREMMDRFPDMRRENLLGGIEYTEFQTSDSRLTLENIKSAISLGGVALSRLQVSELIIENGKLAGVEVNDLKESGSLKINATCVVNATGAWTDQFLSKKFKGVKQKIRPSKGVHLVFGRERLGVNSALYFDVPDGRMMFLIPEDEIVYVGTTDTFYDGDIAKLSIDTEEAQYILDACNNLFPGLNLRFEDIKGGWAGVRPLIDQENKKPSEISRRHEIFKESNGLLSIAGGKLTGYRKMAERIVDVAIIDFFSGKDLKKCHTSNLKLTGSDFIDNNDFLGKRNDFVAIAILNEWKKSEALWVYAHFGSQSPLVLESKTYYETQLPEYLHKSLIYSLNFELVLTAEDFFIRRTNLFYFYPDLVWTWMQEVINIISFHLNLSDEDKHEEKKKLYQQLHAIKGLKITGV